MYSQSQNPTSHVRRHTDSEIDYPDRLTRVLRELSFLDRTDDIEQQEAVMCATGGFCDVFMGQLRVYSRRPITVAVKRLRIQFQDDPLFAERIAREIKIWYSLSHPNILPLLGYKIEGGRYPALITEWMFNGTVSRYLATNPEVDIFFMIQGIAAGVAYLHSKDVVHSDLKAANVLISPYGMPLVTDFGISHALATSSARAQTTSGAKGTVRWMAVELFGFGSSSTRATKHSDVWAFGMTVYEILTKGLPFAHLRNDAQVMSAILHGEIPQHPKNFENLREFDRAMWALCQSCWDRRPEKRPTMDKVLKGIMLAAGCLRWYSRTDPSELMGKLQGPPLKRLLMLNELEGYIDDLIGINAHNVEAIVAVPVYEEGGELIGVDKPSWVYHQLRRIVKDLSHPLLTELRRCCTRLTCPRMFVRGRTFPCLHDDRQCSAMKCSFELLKNAKQLLDSPTIFPSHIVIYPESSEYLMEIVRDLGVIFAHAYHYHPVEFAASEFHSSLYARFLLLTAEYDLVDESQKDIHPTLIMGRKRTGGWRKARLIDGAPVSPSSSRSTGSTFNSFNAL